MTQKHTGTNEDKFTRDPTKNIRRASGADSQGIVSVTIALDAKEDRSKARESQITESLDTDHLAYQTLPEAPTLTKSVHERSHGDIVCVMNQGSDKSAIQVLVSDDSHVLRARMTTTGSNVTQIAGIFRDKEILLHVSKHAEHH